MNHWMIPIAAVIVVPVTLAILAVAAQVLPAILDWIIGDSRKEA